MVCQEKLLSGLVRDVDSTFLDLKIELPSKDGEIDFEWISNYVKSREKQVIGDMYKHLHRNRRISHAQSSI